VTNRGRLLPIATRLEIRRLRTEERLTVREVSRRIGVSFESVLKYGPKNLRGSSEQTS
jgi:DNA-binding transcriptional regulator YiaG